MTLSDMSSGTKFSPKLRSHSSSPFEPQTSSFAAAAMNSASYCPARTWKVHCARQKKFSKKSRVPIFSGHLGIVQVPSRSVLDSLSTIGEAISKRSSLKPIRHSTPLNARQRTVQRLFRPKLFGDLQVPLLRHGSRWDLP